MKVQNTSFLQLLQKMSTMDAMSAIIYEGLRSNEQTAAEGAQKIALEVKIVQKARVLGPQF